MKQLTPILLSLITVAFLAINGWWAVQWGKTNRDVRANELGIARMGEVLARTSDVLEIAMENQVAIARMGEVLEIATKNQVAIAEIKSTRFTEADGAQSLLEVWIAIAELQKGR